ncbi:hypothetical protein [Actinokineospora sp. NBRC 105648]|uniref:hypothetical protein n=1 Tax=Actinokineospora sp. NBRC 105648 TaxID=3032206 RepID=UPI0024A3656E|nr:hypothetical protein [Actinokineospora sp. NBRC 105648]GLZ37878.1 hypothetical protein Acsp05_15020 [Actinokineospora sp. NBRC 105648]
MLTLLFSLWSTAQDKLRVLARDERGTTTENIIWIAGLAAIAIAVIAIWGPNIMTAISKVKFSP